MSPTLAFSPAAPPTLYKYARSLVFGRKGNTASNVCLYLSVKHQNVSVDWFEIVESGGYIKFLGKDAWMNDLRFYVLFISILVISGRLADDNEKLCAMAK